MKFCKVSVSGLRSVSASVVFEVVLGLFSKGRHEEKAAYMPFYSFWNIHSSKRSLNDMIKLRFVITYIFKILFFVNKAGVNIISDSLKSLN